MVLQPLMHENRGYLSKKFTKVINHSLSSQTLSSIFTNPFFHSTNLLKNLQILQRTVNAN